MFDHLARWYSEIAFFTSKNLSNHITTTSWIQSQSGIFSNFVRAFYSQICSFIFVLFIFVDFFISFFFFLSFFFQFAKNQILTANQYTYQSIEILIVISDDGSCYGYYQHDMR